MTIFARSAVFALAVSIGTLLAACGAARPASSASTTVNEASVSLVANLPSVFSNSVPERPWWDKVASYPKPAGPTALTWTLSGDILFDSGSATLSTSALSQLSGILVVARHHCDATITVLGYSDSVPDPTFPGGNQGLSSDRAAAIANVIEGADISGDRIQVAGEGASDPVDDNNTASGRQANRRVIIELSAPATGCPTSSATSPGSAG